MPTSGRRWRIAAISLLAFFGLGACGRPAGTTSDAAPPAGVGTPDARAEALTLASRGDWEHAITRYRDALREAPVDVGLRYGLGVALTHVGRRDEAAEQLRWVARQDPAGRPEVGPAREWLARVGLPPASDARSSPPDTAATVNVAPGEPVGRVRGRTSWPEVSPETRPMRLQMLLDGDDSFTRGRRFWTRTRLGDRYGFDDVQPGAYRLVAQVGAIRLWETRVTVEAGRETVIDLTHALSPVSPDDFPLPAGR